MRGVRRTRPATRAREKGTEEKENMEEKEELEAEEQGMMRGRMRRKSGSKWHLTWVQVAHTPRP